MNKFNNIQLSIHIKMYMIMYTQNKCKCKREIEYSSTSFINASINRDTTITFK